jgi:hypothetical protein
MQGSPPTDMAFTLDPSFEQFQTIFGAALYINFKVLVKRFPMQQSLYLQNYFGPD